MDKQVRCSSQYTCLQTAEHVVWMKKAHTEKWHKQRGFGPVSSNQDQIHIERDNISELTLIMSKFLPCYMGMLVSALKPSI